MQPAIELKRLSREFGERVVLAGVSLRVDRGETLAVAGPNGAGKTTLLRILAGLLRPTAGLARVLGAELPREAWSLRGRVGWLGDEPLLYRDLSARENLRFAARLHGVPPEAAADRIEELLDAVGLAGRGNEPVRHFSSGMLQRTAICRALLHDPELLLLDEPMSHLDTEARETVSPLITASEHRTRVIVSHDPGEIEAERLLRLDARGAPVELAPA